MKLYVLLVIGLLVLFSACSTTTTTVQDDSVVTVEDKGKTQKVTVTSEEGTQTVKVKGTGSDDWCQEGAEWEMSGTQGAAKMEIQGKMTSGKYTEYCHVTYDIDMEGAQGNIDYYFTEDGSGYQVMNMNGQKIETEWTAPE